MKDICINGKPLWLITLINFVTMLLIVNSPLNPGVDGFMTVYFYMLGWCIAWFNAIIVIKSRSNE